LFSLVSTAETAARFVTFVISHLTNYDDDEDDDDNDDDDDDEFAYNS